MEEKRPRKTGIAFRLISLLIVAAAVALGLYAARAARLHPTTSDASIDADIVHIAATVGGRISEIRIHENDRVDKDSVLFQIDPEPYRLVLQQAEAELAAAEAALETQRKIVATQASAAAVASEQVTRASANLELASRTVERIKPLAAKGYVPTQQLDQAETTKKDATTSLTQALEQKRATETAVDTDAGARALVLARTAAVAIARRALDNTTVRASVSGHVVGLSVLAGEVIAPTQSLFTLVADEEWFAVANFRETELNAIGIGDCATVYSMIDRARPIKALVQGIGAGIADAERITLPRSLPIVQKSLNWVTVAQRFPVRLKLEHPPEELVRLGATAVVEVKHGPACR